MNGFNQYGNGGKKPNYNANKESKELKLALYLRPDEIHRMFEKAKMYSQRDFKTLMLLYYFGLRNNEMTALCKEHIDIIGKTLKVVQGKNSKDRIIPIVELNPFGNKDSSILDHLAVWKGGKEETGILIEGDSADGTISDRTVRRRVKRYAELAKVTRASEVHPHTLRHSYATHLYNMGVPLDIVQRLLGHSSVNTTQIYAHLGVNKLRIELRKAINTIEYKRNLPERIAAIEKNEDVAVKTLEYQKLTNEAIRILLGV